MLAATSKALFRRVNVNINKMSFSQVTPQTSPRGEGSGNFNLFTGLGRSVTTAVSRSLLDAPSITGAVFFVCDIQEAFRDRCLRMPEVISIATHMMRAAHVLDIPIVVTEQYVGTLKCQLRS
jgi:hypothetical protein